MPRPLRLGAAALLGLLCLLVGHVGAAPRAVPAGGTVVVALASDLLELDPGRASDRSSWRVLSCLFETLVRPGPEPGQVRPGLALSWESQEGGRVWTFHLRRDVYFHDGRPMNAAAVAASLRRQFDPLLTPQPERRARFLFFRSLLGGRPPVVQQVAVVDPDSVRIVLRQPVRDFLELLAHPPAAIVAPSMVASRESSPAPVGTGPFRLAERRPGQRVALDSNPYYWGGRPPLDHLIFTVVPQASSRTRELTRGNADLAVALDPLEVEALKASGRFQVATAGGLNSWGLVMNCSRHPWSDLRARVALQHALPRVELARRFVGSRGQAATGVLSPRSWAWDSTERGYAWQPDRARRLLSRIRFPRSYSVDLLYPTETPVLADPAGLASRVAQGLVEVGLPVTPRGLAPEDWSGCLRQGAYDLALLFQEQGQVDPDVALYPLWSRGSNTPGGTNLLRFSSGRLQDLLDMARTAPERRDRARLYREIQQQLLGAAPLVPLAWSLEITAWRQSLQGVSVDRLGLLDFSRAWLGHR